MMLNTRFTVWNIEEGNPVQPSKAPSPMLFTLLGISMEVKPVQSLKA